MIMMIIDSSSLTVFLYSSWKVPSLFTLYWTAKNARLSKSDVKLFFLFDCFRDTEFGDIFSTIGVREPQPEASLAFSKFGETHRLIEKKGIQMLRSIKVVMSDLNTFLNKAVPDTRLTIKKYADVKFEYLVCTLVCDTLDRTSIFQIPVRLWQNLTEVQNSNVKNLLEVQKTGSIAKKYENEKEEE